MTTLIDGTTIDETTWDSPNYTPAALVPQVFGQRRTTSRITIHHWGNDGQSFNNVANYLSRPNGNSSAHFVVEAGRVACLISPANAAWHSGSPIGNATSTGLECRPEMAEGDLNTLVALIVYLEEAYGEQEIWLHKEWSATACPGRYQNMRDEIVRRVNAAKGGSNNAHAPASSSVSAVQEELAKIRASADRIGQIL